MGAPPVCRTGRAGKPVAGSLQTGSASERARTCPNSKSPMGEEDLLCTSCGYNSVTGRMVYGIRPSGVRADVLESRHAKMIEREDERKIHEIKETRTKSNRSFIWGFGLFAIGAWLLLTNFHYTPSATWSNGSSTVSVEYGNDGSQSVTSTGTFDTRGRATGPDISDEVVVALKNTVARKRFYRMVALGLGFLLTGIGGISAVARSPQ